MSGRSSWLFVREEDSGRDSGLSPVAELGSKRETWGCGVVVEQTNDEMPTLKYFGRQFRKQI